MAKWSEIQDISIDLSDLKDDAIIDMIKIMSREERQRLLDLINKETKENKDLTRSIQLALRLAGLAITVLI